ncbi:monovalent cation/H+ antiporter subunit A [Ideonella sp. A 288]|uniref:monovalent cation/H+ antiporter subunit A n=1 Tax=Ideonella sp. A 288 TaxID=1962181 RepID=UPI000B4AD8B4|nr:monovalent cation/H+ antiporter subunit A [Ideonella sp. A 288]
MRLFALALLPWLGAALVGSLPAAARRAQALAAGAVAMGVTALALLAAPAVFDGQVLRASVPWLPALGMDLGFRLDGLAWLFVLLIGGIGALVVLYAAWYLDPDDPHSPSGRFFVFLLLFMGAMLGVVLADNLVLLVLFWELTSLASFLLIGYWHGRDDVGRDAREGARMALAITGAGGLCLLAGVLLLGHIVGSVQLDDVLASGDLIRAHPLYVVALVLVLLGAFTKSAQFPFHFWLPHAMAAPTPVSAYLHSATMVKCGVFLLARLYPALGGSEPWFWIVTSVGLSTMLLGAYIAIFQHDLKGLLAYSTISHLGLITLLFGLSEPLAVVAGVFHILNHAIFKAGLFMSAGIIDHECGTRDMRRINGLMKPMPFTATLGIVAALSMAGVPLLNGFLSKEMFFAEALAKDSHGAMEWLLPAGATLAGALSVAYSLRFIHDTFFNGEPVGLPKVPHEAPFFMRLPVLLLVLLCLAVGLAPALVAGPLLAVAAQAALHGAPGPALPAYHLAVWHGFNGALLMSAIAVVAGVALYAALHRGLDLHRVTQLPGALVASGRDLFARLQSAGVGAAGTLVGALQNGRLQGYLLLLVLMALAAGAAPFVLSWGPSAAPAALHVQGLNPLALALGLLGSAAALGTALLHRQRVVAVVLMGGAGLVVCLVFVGLSAPDLALTQLLVEVVSVVLLMLALKWLPDESPAEHRTPWPAARDAVLALVVGLGVAALVWMVLTRPGQSVSDFFFATTLPQGGGANTVNVIIVDYRGFDTLGEITVLVIAALTLHALLAGWAPPAAPVPVTAGQAHPLMLQRVARLVLPFVVLISVFLYLRGHNLPGGGFIAGLVLAIGLVLMQVAHGQAWVRDRSPLLGGDFRAWLGWGLGLAAATGLASWLFAAPFLTTTYDYPWLPGIGGVPLASASAFDLGVYLVVVGATMAMLLAIARLSMPSPVRPMPE